MTAPTITAIIPVHNGEKFLGQAVASIRAQSLPVEIVVVDDGSSDATAQVAQALPGVRYFFQPHAGLAPALNRGVREASGTLLGFLDHDDLWTPAKLALQVQALTAEPMLEAVFGATEQFFEEPGLAQKLRVEVQQANARHLSAMLIRQEAFARIGAFDPAFGMATAMDWQHRAAAAGLRARWLDSPVHRRRIHGANHSLDRKELHGRYFDVLRASLRRRGGS